MDTFLTDSRPLWFYSRVVGSLLLEAKSSSVLLCTFSDLQLYHSETLELMLQRWSKLERDFRQKSGRYDISKIPDIYDCVKYDVQHNGSLGLQGTAELLRLSKALADVVIPQVCLVQGSSMVGITRGKDREN